LAKEIAADSRDILTEAGLMQNLTPTRRNGLAAVRKRIGEWAQQLS
jgi:sulfur transfer protein SufE